MDQSQDLTFEVDEPQGAAIWQFSGVHLIVHPVLHSQQRQRLVIGCTAYMQAVKASYARTGLAHLQRHCARMIAMPKSDQLCQRLCMSQMALQNLW